MGNEEKKPEKKPEQKTEKRKKGSQANINKDQFENLCRLQCTEAEICGWFGVVDKTLVAWCRRTYGKTFQEVFQEKRQGGKISLRRTQWRLAEKSAAMSIWLGKQYLGQRDPDKEIQEEKKDEGVTIINDIQDTAADAT